MSVCWLLLLFLCLVSARPNFQHKHPRRDIHPAYTTETVTLYRDSNCTVSAGPLVNLTLPLTSAGYCFHQLVGSYINQCFLQTDRTSVLRYQVWLNNSNCKDDPDTALLSSGPVGSCNSVSVTNGGKTSSLYGVVVCPR